MSIPPVSGDAPPPKRIKQIPTIQNQIGSFNIYNINNINPITTIYNFVPTAATQQTQSKKKWEFTSYVPEEKVPSNSQLENMYKPIEKYPQNVFFMQASGELLCLVSPEKVSIYNAAQNTLEAMPGGIDSTDIEQIQTFAATDHYFAFGCRNGHFIIYDRKLCQIVHYNKKLGDGKIEFEWFNQNLFICHPESGSCILWSAQNNIRSIPLEMQLEQGITSQIAAIKKIDPVHLIIAMNDGTLMLYDTETCAISKTSLIKLPCCPFTLCYDEHTKNLAVVYRDAKFSIWIMQLQNDFEIVRKTKLFVDPFKSIQWHQGHLWVGNEDSVLKKITLPIAKLHSAMVSDGPTNGYAKQIWIKDKLFAYTNGYGMQILGLNETECKQLDNIISVSKNINYLPVSILEALPQHLQDAILLAFSLFKDNAGRKIKISVDYEKADRVAYQGRPLKKFRNNSWANANLEDQLRAVTFCRAHFILLSTGAGRNLLKTGDIDKLDSSLS